MGHITHSHYWNALMRKVLGPRSGGAKIVVDAEDAELGIGKTSAAVSQARLCARAFDYEMTTDDLTLSAQEYIERYREHPPDRPSVIVLDEAVGAGAGDSRRGMSNENVELYRAWQVLRTRQVVTFTTVAHWGDMDTRLQRLADFRLWTRKRPLGTFRPYEVAVDFDDAAVKTRRLDDAIHFPKMDDDPLYEAISEEKDKFIDAGVMNADALVEDDESAAENTETTEARKDRIREVVEILREQGVEAVTNTHNGNGTEYIDADLIEFQYADLSQNQARKVKSVLEADSEISVA